MGQGAPTVERRYHLSSLRVDVEKFASAVPGHWMIENSLCWVLDVQGGEDRSCARAGQAAANLARLRRLALNCLKQEHTKGVTSKANDSMPPGITPTFWASWHFDASALSFTAFLQFPMSRSTRPGGSSESQKSLAKSAFE